MQKTWKGKLPKMLKCPACRNEGIIDPQYGLIACLSCREKTTRMSERTYEFVPEHIKEERKEFKDQTIQPFRNGVLSKEYIDMYGTKHITATEEEVKNAKNVWGRDLGDYYK